MNVFIAGARGQLGQDCMNVLAMGHRVAGMDLPELDIADPDCVARCLDPFAPQAIVNAAAYTRVDDCEGHEDEARRANADGPRVLTQYAAARSIRLLHISTDYVFDGQRPPPAPYVESDPPQPLSAYGRTKLAGEQAIARAGTDHVILRTAWLYGAHGHNFLKTILRLARRRPNSQPLRIVNDQHGSPTASLTLARQIAVLLDSPSASGVYHATAHGHCTWYDLAVRFLDLMGLSCPIEACSTADFPTPARRPLNSILENARLLRAGLDVMQHWQQDVTDFVRDNKPALLAETRQDAS